MRRHPVDKALPEGRGPWEPYLHNATMRAIRARRRYFRRLGIRHPYTKHARAGR